MSLFGTFIANLSDIVKRETIMECIMKIAVTSEGKELSSAVDPRFGRAKYFVVFDTDSAELFAADNKQNLTAPQGAGIQAGRTIVELGVQAVISGHVGPKAFATLRAGNVLVYTGAEGTVNNAITKFKSGELKLQESADVKGHWM